MRLAEFKQAREPTGEIEMSVTGRTSCHEIAILVWFVEKSAKVSLLGLWQGFVPETAICTAKVIYARINQ